MTENIYRLLINLKGIYDYWDLVIKYGCQADINGKIPKRTKYLMLKRDAEAEIYVKWINENTNIDLNYLNETILEYELKLRDSEEDYKSERKPKPKEIKKKKRRLSYGVQLKNAKKKATKRVKKWLKEPKGGNWWVDEFNKSKVYSYYNDNNYDYSYRKSYKVPSWLIEVDTNKWCLNKDKDFLL